MLKRMNGEFLFGLFMLSVFAAGAYDLIGGRSLDAVLRDTGALFALSMILLSMCLLIAVTLTSILRSGAENKVIITPRGILIAAVSFAYPVLFWAAEYLIATFVIGAIVQSLFVSRFGAKSISIAFGFAMVTYLIFFFLLGLTEPDGALFTTGLNDRMPVWRRDFFASF